LEQELEIEYKNILTTIEFESLVNFFKLSNKQFVMQENHYFDTPDFSLKSHGAALRIRNKAGKYTLTLKQPAEVGLLETSQTINDEEASFLLNGGSYVDHKFEVLLKALDINPTMLEYFGSLRTSRAEIPYKNGLLVFDHSYYFDVEDYEIEYEVSNAIEGKGHFEELLRTQNIPIRNTENKIMRFYKEKLRLNSKAVKHED
jgi:uncharacterized protein YjbK